MREIKFRAKDFTNEWRFGSLLERKYFDFKNGKEILNYFILVITSDWTNSNAFAEKEYLIQHNTIGQYTGLKDKDGKEIYEGDVVRQQSFSSIKDTKYKNDKDRIRHIKYLKNKCGCIFDNDTDYHHNYDDIVKYEDARFYPFADDNFEWGNYNNDKPVEVIGNIFDNPELCGGRQ